MIVFSMIQFLALLFAVVLYNALGISAFTYRDISLKASRDSGSSVVEFPSGELPHSLPQIFWSRRSPGQIPIFRRYRCLKATGGDKGDGSKKGYRFGDITKSLIGGRVEKITGKSYEFGGKLQKLR